MGLLKAVEVVVLVGIQKAIAQFSRVWCPVVHAERQANGWVGVAIREFHARMCAHQWVDIAGESLGMTPCRDSRGQEKGEEFFA